MKTFLKLSISIFISLLVVSCFSKKNSLSENENPQLPNTGKKYNCIPTTSDDKLEIVTWNIEHFPKRGMKTIKEVANLIKQMNVDVIAFQEIKSKKDLNELVSYLPNYKSAIMERTDINLAYLYKTSEITLNSNPYQLQLEKNAKKKAFAYGRNPFVLPIHSKSTNLDIIVVNNHLKASSHYDKPKKKIENIERRKRSSFLLKKWIDKKYPKDNVIILGDLNDEITDPKDENVFQIFIDDKMNYHFADRFIAEKKNKKEWSYPGFPSHIDHILITNELFDNEEKTYTYKFEKCIATYRKNISDHQPVCLVLKQ